MNLEQYVEENPTSTLTEVQSYSEVKGKKLSADLMRSFLNHPQVQLYNYFKGATTDIEATLIGEDYYNIGDLKMTTFDNMAGVGEFNFITGHPSDQTGLIDVLIYAETNPALQEQLSILKVVCLNYCNQLFYPFAEATQAQLNRAKDLFASKTITHTAGKYIVLTLNADLAEKLAATTWLKETGFADENAGRNVYIQAAQRYKIDMSGKKSGDYEIRVPLLDADFTVESV